jgi:hypothetical protein
MAESTDAREIVGVEDLEIVVEDSEESVPLAPCSETRCLP